MTSLTRRALALPAGAGALAIATLATQAFIAAPAQSAAVHRPATTHGGWRLVKTISIHDRQVLPFSIDAVSANDAWMAGNVFSANSLAQQPLLEHWDGAAWRRVALPARLTSHFTGEDFFGLVGASSAANVWAIGARGKYLRRVGGHWTFGRLPFNRSGRTAVDAVKVFSPTDVWVFGQKARGLSSTSKFEPFAARFNGRRWTVMRVPGQGPMSPVSAVGPRDIWAVMDGYAALEDNPPATGIVVHWNGVSWQKVPPLPKLTGQSILDAIVAKSSTDVWAAGGIPNSKHGLSLAAWHWNGRTWTVKSPRSAATGQQFFISGLATAPGGLWALSGSFESTSRMWRYSSRWSGPARLPWTLYQLAAVPHSTSIWAIGESANLNNALIVLHGPVPR